MKSTIFGNLIVDLMGKCPFSLTIVSQRLMGNVVPTLKGPPTQDQVNSSDSWLVDISVLHSLGNYRLESRILVLC